MSYARMLETGTYIWPDGENVNFKTTPISNSDINIFLARLYDTRRNEFKERALEGRRLIEQNRMDKLC